MQEIYSPGVEIEDVSGVGLPAGGTAEQERHLSVGDGLLGQVVEDDERVHPVVAEELAHGAAGVGRQVLQRGSVGGGGRNDDAVRRDAILNLQ